MHPNLIRKLRTLLLLCVLTSFAGAIYELIDENELSLSSVMFGLPLGLGFGLLELFLLPAFRLQHRQWSFTRTLVFKALLYTVVIYTISLSVSTIIGFLQHRAIEELKPILFSAESLILVFYTLTVYTLLVFLLQINLLLGEGVLWKFIRGKYHRPREEERIFMFLDMKSSTTIAEQLGHVRFYALMNELFYEISEPALQTKAEIYQYIGDEMVLTWEMKDGLRNGNCLRTFFMFRERIWQNSEGYFMNYGVRPQFKAGLHFGKVISAQIGDIKKEIVYNGDVLNTASRIQNECNKYKRDFLVSGTLMNRLKEMNGFHWEMIDTVVLRGKEQQVEIYSVRELSQP